MNIRYYKCKFRKGTFCTCPKDKETNATGELCKQPMDCPERERQLIAKG